MEIFVTELRINTEREEQPCSTCKKAIRIGYNALYGDAGDIWCSEECLRQGIPALNLNLRTKGNA